MIFRSFYSRKTCSINERLITLLGIFTLIILLISCGNEEPTQEIINEVIEETFIDDANAEKTAADTSSTGVYQEEVIEAMSADRQDETSLQDAMKSNTKAVTKEEGMSFCDCVKKNKKLSDIMMADETSDADFDKAMKELEDMKTNACKIMFPIQSNIDEQKAHQRKVKNCLGK